MEITTLKNPPIIEALLEIRFNPNKDIKISKLEEFANSLTNYPNKKPVESQRFEFMYLKEAGQQHKFDAHPSGFKMHNAQNNRIVIGEIDKLVVSFLPPYESWPSLKDTTRDIFNKYIGFVPQTQISRIGMRYINKLKLPLTDDFNFQNYITTFQPLPKYNDELPNKLAKFETFVVVPLEDIGCTSTIRQVTLDAEEETPGPAYLPFILDVDIFQIKLQEDIKGNDIWETFNKMREKRNAIFFGSLTDAALEPYK
ncbi:MAG: TIGR04255 family protein [Gammaproteobacteria bacterium]|nr:TIGR04255 family protein [Gammaproteobacteria bacterium]